MATYTNNTPTCENGSSTFWPAYGSGTGGYFGLDGDVVAFARFTGATAMLAATTVQSATLAVDLTKLGVPTDEKFQIWAELAENASLPVDWTDASGRSLTSSSVTTGSLNGLSSISIDIKSVIQELQTAVNGDVVMLKIVNPNYSGTGMEEAPPIEAFTLTVVFGDTRSTQLLKCCC